ncbi:phage holin family protein [Bacillus sp. FJAT-27245]|uniref:phage holin family protein n=1 Tax=Bacillus sp. FJAT-27245 TaxID=1684144 RepID=UPI0006A78A2C|nr:phage holin family protein [Bacillus sp. FJAT-27245]
MALVQFLHAHFFYLIPILWIIGYFLKHSSTVPRHAIIWLLLAVALIIALIVFGLKSVAVSNAIIVAAIAVFIHQLYKQTVKWLKARR